MEKSERLRCVDPLIWTVKCRLRRQALLDSRCYYSFVLRITYIHMYNYIYIYILQEKWNCVVMRSHYYKRSPLAILINGIVFTSDRYLIYRCTHYILLLSFRSFKRSVISTSVNKCNKHSKVTGYVRVTRGRFGFVDTGRHNVYFYSLVFPKSAALLIEKSGLLFCCCERILYLKVSWCTYKCLNV